VHFVYGYGNNENARLISNNTPSQDHKMLETRELQT